MQMNTQAGKFGSLKTLDTIRRPSSGRDPPQNYPDELQRSSSRDMPNENQSAARDNEYRPSVHVATSIGLRHRSVAASRDKRYNTGGIREY